MGNLDAYSWTAAGTRKVVGLLLLLWNTWSRRRRQILHVLDKVSHSNCFNDFDFLSGIKELNKTLEENKSLAVQNRQLLKEMENLREQIASSENRNKDLVHSRRTVCWLMLTNRACSGSKQRIMFFLIGFERERQRLKQDKSYLLNQVDEMQKSLDDKEEQLRDFIREFELQMKAGLPSRSSITLLPYELNFYYETF